MDSALFEPVKSEQDQAMEAAQREKTATLGRLPAGYQHFLFKISALKDSPESADFVIKSGNREFKVLRHVVKLHSDASEPVLKPGFKDWTDPTEPDSMEADDQAAAKVVDFFYLLEYDIEPDNLDIHSRVYSIADRYFMPDLKVYAKKRFEVAASKLFRMALYYGDDDEPPEDGPLWHQIVPSIGFMDPETVENAKRPHPASRHLRLTGRRPDLVKIEDIDPSPFFDVIPYVYASSLPSNPGLRRSVIRMWNSLDGYQKKALGKDRWRKLSKENEELAMDLVVGFGEEPNAKTAVLLDSREEVSIVPQRVAFDEQPTRFYS